MTAGRRARLVVSGALVFAGATAGTATGNSTVTITATSQATLYSFSKVVSTGQLMPWGVMRTTWTPGQSYPI